MMVDEEGRENEGDVMIAAEMVTAEAINFMATHARGLICLALTGERADSHGVMERRGQTEPAVDLARLAGLNPSGVFCEIANEDGAIARLPDLIRFCLEHDLKLISVADPAGYFSGQRWPELETLL